MHTALITTISSPTLESRRNFLSKSPTRSDLCKAVSAHQVGSTAWHCMGSFNHQKPSIFHQTLPTTAKISSSTTHITNPTRHQFPIVTKPLPKMIGEVPVA
jgi:hypothetical protein